MVRSENLRTHVNTRYVCFVGSRGWGGGWGNYSGVLNVKRGSLKELIMLLSAVYVYTLLCSCFCAVERLVFIWMNCLVTVDEYLCY